MTATWIAGEGNVYRVRQEFSSVAAASSSTREAVPINSFGGVITQVAISTVNDIEFTFNLLQHATNPLGSVDEIYRVEGCTQFWQKEQHHIRFVNSDDPPTTNLYLEVTNEDLITATGTITLVLWIKASGRGVQL